MKDILKARRLQSESEFNSGTNFPTRLSVQELQSFFEFQRDMPNKNLIQHPQLTIKDCEILTRYYNFPTLTQEIGSKTSRGIWR